MTRWLLASALFLVLFSGSQVEAAQIHAVKDDRVIINLEGATPNPGDEFFLIDNVNNKRRGIVRIIQVKSSRAMAEVIRGGARKGFKLQAKGRSRMSADVTPERLRDFESSLAGGVPEHHAFARKGASAEPLDTIEPDLGRSPMMSSQGKSRSPRGGLRTELRRSFGVFAGLTMNSMDTTVVRQSSVGPTPTPVSMQGTGLSGGGYADFVVRENISVRGYLGIDQFNVKGTAQMPACNSSTNCVAEIMFMTAMAHVKWYPSPGAKWRPWVGAGAGYLMAATSNTNALMNVGSFLVFGGAGGVDVQLSRRAYIPVSVEYNMFPSSNSTTANSILIRAGWGWYF